MLAPKEAMRPLHQLRTVLIVCFLLLTGVAIAQPEPAGLSGLRSEKLSEVSAGIAALAASGDPSSLSILEALHSDKLAVDEGGHLIIRAESGTLNALTMQPLAPQGKARAVPLNNLARRNLDGALARLRLTSPVAETRRAAALELSAHPDAEIVEVIRPLIPGEKDAETKRLLLLSIAKLDLTSPDKARRLAAARAIVDSDDISLEADLAALSEPNKQGTYGESDPEVRAELHSALVSVRKRLFVINTVANTIYGLSLGSVLVLAALGLAITFGLMRVINMAHGEMLMLGAYSTYFVREQLLKISPAAAEAYLFVAIPFAFLTACMAGVLLERLVIRHLYGRPLETLLATWGLSLVLIQLVRVVFGAQNVTVANPDWLSGGLELMPALVVPYSRIAVLGFTAAVVLFVGFILKGTSLGLQVRAVTQNREIAAGLGIATHRVDMWTFGLGSGLAGLGGVALSQLGNVGPELGQQHIMDSFVVVVMGGVGNILGTVLAGVGLGILNKLLEPSVGAVLGKILLLGLLILFIQWRPQGLFALKGRAAEN
jgi:urea transport system permease protein